MHNSCKHSQGACTANWLGMYSRFSMRAILYKAAIMSVGLSACSALAACFQRRAETAYRYTLVRFSVWSEVVCRSSAATVLPRQSRCSSDGKIFLFFPKRAPKQISFFSEKGHDKTRLSCRGSTVLVCPGVRLNALVSNWMQPLASPAASYERAGDLG